MAFASVQTKRAESNDDLYYLVINHHSTAESRITRFLARSVLLALFIVSLPYFGSIVSEIGDVTNYRIVYLERSESKLGQNEIESPSRRRLFAYESADAKRAAALKDLEDVLLEPPRAASRRSRRYLKRTRYLPDLMDDSLESYPRHVFIDVGGSGTNWFNENYPTRNKKFEIYTTETVSADQDPTSNALQIGMSDWLTKNVRAEDYVVMKAEAEVVEEMMKSKTVRLVDELFLECKPDMNGGRKVLGGARRPYWQCLALYGQLRDQGVAVHQWWG